MKNITLALAAILCGSSSTLIPSVGTKPLVSIEQPAAEQKLGKDAIAQIRKDYEEGRYDDFLKEMDASYESLLEKDKLSGLASFRKGKAAERGWVDAANLLQKQKNQQLLDAVADQKSLFAQKVRSASTEQVTPEQEQAILHLAHFRQMPPGSGKDSDENALIDLDLEYEYKSIHLDMPVIDGQPVPDRREKHYVLKMDYTNKLLSAAQSFEDASLKKDVELYAQNLDERMAQNWDQYDLTALTKGKVKPADSVQEKVVSILQAHQEKIGDLTKQVFDAEKK